MNEMNNHKRNEVKVFFLFIRYSGRGKVGKNHFSRGVPPHTTPVSLLSSFLFTLVFIISLSTRYPFYIQLYIKLLILLKVKILEKK